MGTITIYGAAPTYGTHPASIRFLLQTNFHDLLISHGIKTGGGDLREQQQLPLQNYAFMVSSRSVSDKNYYMQCCLQTKKEADAAFEIGQKTTRWDKKSEKEGQCSENSSKMTYFCTQMLKRPFTSPLQPSSAETQRLQNEHGFSLSLSKFPLSVFPSHPFPLNGEKRNSHGNGRGYEQERKCE